MSRTITQIEHDIDNSVNIKILEYLKDYLAKQLNVAISDIDGELQKIFTEVQGLDKIVSVIPKPLAPSATDPTTANDGDLFFNTTDKWFKYYQGGTWHNLAHLDTTIDAYTKTEADTKFALAEHIYTIASFQNNETNGVHYLIGTKPTGIENLPDGSRVKLDMRAINTLAQTPANIPQDDARVFISLDIPVYVKPNNYMEFGSATNAGESFIKNDYDTKYLVGIFNKNADGTMNILFEKWEPFISGPTWKDITATYQTRRWTKDDVGKVLKITYIYGAVFSGILYSSGIGTANNEYYISATTPNYETLLWSPNYYKHPDLNGKIVQLPQAPRNSSFLETITNKYDITKVEIYE